MKNTFLNVSQNAIFKLYNKNNLIVVNLNTNQIVISFKYYSRF